jgi:DNA polymerase-3 subunit alpha
MVENLARAGAFDCLGVERRQALTAAERILAAAYVAAAERAAAQNSLFGDEEPVGGDILPEIEPWTAHERLDEEFAAIGVYLSGHPLEDATEALARRNVVFCAQFAALAEEGRERVKVAGVVRARQERVSLKSQERFAFVSLSDPTGEFEALVPPETLARERSLLETGAPVFGSARLSGRDGEVRVIIDRVEPLDSALSGAFGGMRIYAEDEGALSAVSARLNKLSERQGGDRGQVSIVVPMGERDEVELALPGAWPVDAAARAAIKIAQGVAKVEEA